MDRSGYTAFPRVCARSERDQTEHAMYAAGLACGEGRGKPPIGRLAHDPQPAAALNFPRCRAHPRCLAALHGVRCRKRCREDFPHPPSTEPRRFGLARYLNAGPCRILVSVRAIMLITVAIRFLNSRPRDPRPYFLGVTTIIVLTPTILRRSPSARIDKAVVLKQVVSPRRFRVKDTACLRTRASVMRLRLKWYQRRAKSSL